MTGPVGPVPTVAVAAIVVDDERLLLVRRSNPPGAGAWALPGGRVEPGETVAEAVTRELREESGVEGVCGRFVGFGELLPEDAEGEHLIVLDFEVHLLEAVEPVAGSDADDVRWVYLGDVAEMHLAPGVAEFLHDHRIIDTIT